MHCLRTCLVSLELLSLAARQGGPLPLTLCGGQGLQGTQRSQPASMKARKATKGTRRGAVGAAIPSLPTAVQHYILSLLPPNKRALSGRLVDKEASDALKDDCTIYLSQPLPPHAAPWVPQLGLKPLRHKTIEQKLRLLCTAASSGSVVNLVAWAILQPSIYPEMFNTRVFFAYPYPDPGEAAAKAGHIHLLGWLVRHCPILLRPVRVLQAAAHHCDLAGLQAAWEALQGESAIFLPVLNRSVLNAAAESCTPDAVAKMEWVLTAGAATCRTDDTTAAAAARSGDLGRLRWLRERGCSFDSKAVVRALQHAELPAVQWLVGAEGAELPAAGSDVPVWLPYLVASAKSPDCAAKLDWLQKRGCPALSDENADLLLELTLAAATAGHVDAVRYLLSRLGQGRVLDVHNDMDCEFEEAVGRSGSIPMAECFCHAGLQFTYWSIKEAMAEGDLAMLRWLMVDADAFTGDLEPWRVRMAYDAWPCETATGMENMLKANQLLARAGLPAWSMKSDIARSALNRAAAAGNLGLVQGMARAGCRPTKDTLEEAVRGGCVALVVWLLEGRVRVKVSTYMCGRLYDLARRAGDRATVDTLRRLGVPESE